MPATFAKLLCDALPEGFVTLEARGKEGMNALSTWEIGVLSSDPAIDLEAALGAPAVLQLVDELEGSARLTGLVVTDIAYDQEGRDGHHYTLALSPREWLLTKRVGYRIFLDKTAPEIALEVLRDAGVPGDEVELRLSTSYAPRPHCTQYRESDWSFIERLLAEEGISYWFDFDQQAERPRLIFGDNPSSHDGVVGVQAIPFEDPGGTVTGRHLFELEIVGEMVPTRVVLRDFDVRAPDVSIEGEAGEGELVYFEYPARVVSSAAAASRAAARLEQLARHKRRAVGKSDCVRLQPGRVLTIEACADDWMNGRYLVTRVEHALRMEARSGSDATSYANQIHLVPAEGAAYRPEPPKSAPRIDGIEPAITTGPAGEEIHVDDLGRVKIRFPWDRSGAMDDRSSSWVRCLQMNLGGSMILPRVGWEVPVAYIDGDPDKPFVLGRLYNATAVVPYALPGGSATSALQSATSPGGGTTNEIRMGDSGGKQEMFIHATKDQTITVGGSADATIGADQTHDVGLSYGVAVKGSQSATIGASQSVNVATDYGITAKGARTEMIGGMEVTKVTANRVVHAKGAYNELVGAAYIIQCNQSNTVVKAAFTQLVGGSLGLAAGLGVGESVAAARTELVGGSRLIAGARNAAESVIGVKNLTAGATVEKAGGAVTTTSKAAGAVKVGGSASIKAGGAVVIDAASITIDVGGSLKTPTFTMSSGALKVKKGTSKLKGTIKHQGVSKIGG